jgi:ABC-type multidrug transport system fused ATPase/permease subunit
LESSGELALEVGLAFLK